jgi:enamine deaminase RidA (YjgF/YER057c/UK114 family)
MAIPEPVQLLERELREIFGPRLQSLVVYGGFHSPHAQGGGHSHAHGQAEPPSRTMVVVEGMTREDLRACAARVEAWHARGLATPLLVAAHEFDRSLDVFPLEFGAILADHVVVSGANPFAALNIDPADVRRACELQARSHLLHLREGYLETRGRADALSDLIVQSAPAFAALLASVARLEGHLSADAAAAARHNERTLGVTGGAMADIVKLTGVHELPSADAERLFAPYLDAVERLVNYVDRWSGR